MSEMEQTNNYNELFFDKQQNQYNKQPNYNQNNYHYYQNSKQLHTPSPHQQPTFENDLSDLAEEETGPHSSASYNKPTTNKRHQKYHDNEDDKGGGGQEDEYEDESFLNRSREDLENLSTYLKQILDIYSFRDSDLFVNELRKLEAYLNNEWKQTKSENALYFFNQREIIDHLNNSIRVRDIIPKYV